tara:strand:- start:1231 stop:1542 length:312 start_codon:yes stop_codon:yes gene_type:complete
MDIEIELEEIELSSGAIASATCYAYLGHETALCNYPSSHNGNQPAEIEVPILESIAGGTVTLWCEFTGKQIWIMKLSELSQINQDIIERAMHDEFNARPEIYS